MVVILLVRAEVGIFLAVEVLPPGAVAPCLRITFALNRLAMTSM